MARKPKTKTEEYVTADRVQRSIRTRFNPLRNLTPALLATQLDDFSAGYLHGAALTWEKIEERDDTIKAVAPKRKKAVSRHGYEILLIEDSPKAYRHKEALEYFYNNLSCENAIDRNFRGGFNLLVRQMMDAVGKMYAAHEIVWRPDAQGITAMFRFIPLWFFENTTGRLRFLRSEGSTSGVELDDGEWLITAADGLMTACSVAYMYKHLPLKDWLGYCERHGFPGVIGKTDAKRGSTEWNNMVAAVQSFAVDWAAVMNTSEAIDGLNIESKGDLPFPKLVERMDRAMTCLWRGADLSTMSSQSGEGRGASLQGDEMDLLEHDDAQMISDTLNAQIDPWVIRYAVGDGYPLAYIKIRTAQKQDVEADLKVDDFLIRNKVPTSVSDVLERYGRPLPDKDEDLIDTSAAPTQPGDSGPTSPEPPAPSLANEAVMVAKVKRHAMAVTDELRATAEDQFLKARANDLNEIREKLEYIQGIEDPHFRTVALRNLKTELPDLLKQMNAQPGTAEILEQTMVAALLNGWAEASTERAITEEAA